MIMRSGAVNEQCSEQFISRQGVVLIMKGRQVE